MKPFITSAALLAALCFTPGVSIAQEPDPAPAPAPAPPAERPRREAAVPRSEAPAPRSQNEGPRQRAETVAREPQAAPAGAVRRENAAAEESSRRRVRAPERATSEAAASEEQGAQRRGASRRPPAARGGGGQGARDRAVPRTSAPRDRDRDRVYVYPDYWSYGRYYDPYYDSGLHLGYLAYSPWGWTPSFYGYPYGYGGGGYAYRTTGFDLGSVKIKVTPRDAEVYVDGYYAGQVDDFDGFLQSLKVDRGGHRIELRKDGFETLQFDVHVQPDRTITYRGEMKPMP